MGITLFTTRVHVSTRLADDRPGDSIAPPGYKLWVVDYTLRQGRREETHSSPNVAPAAARRMVNNLLADILPGLSVDDVYSEDPGVWGE